MEIKEMYNKVCDVEKGLTDWEVEFIESIGDLVYTSPKSLSPKQIKKLEDIYYDRCGGS